MIRKQGQDCIISMSIVLMPVA